MSAFLSGRLSSYRGKMPACRSGLPSYSLGNPRGLVDSFPIFQSNGISLALPGGHVSCLNQSLVKERLLFPDWSGLGHMPSHLAGGEDLPSFGKSRYPHENGVRKGMMPGPETQRIHYPASEGCGFVEHQNIFKYKIFLFIYF